jgi:hypothetical protein
VESNAMCDKCERCNGSGEIAVSTKTFNYRYGGPVSETARGVFSIKCDVCGGSGYKEQHILHQGEWISLAKYQEWADSDCEDSYRDFEIYNSQEKSQNNM